MGANEHNARLMQALEVDGGFKRRGFTASCGPTGGIVVDHWNHVRGVWHFHLTSYFWTPAGSNEPSIRVDTREEAIAYTLNVVAKT